MGVTLSGYIDVPEERLEAVRAALPEHVLLTRAEPGCLRFEVIESSSTPGRFAVSEEFDSPEAFRAHQLRASQSDWGRISEGLPRNYKITGLEE